jgi:hypothetical protein
MSNVKSINGYKVADEDIRNCVAPKFDPYYYSGNVGDIRLHDDHLYKCIESTTGGAPWDESQWTEITLGEEIVTLNRGVRDINNKFEGIHFPTGNAVIPVISLNLHSGETLQLVDKRGFYLVRLSPTTGSGCYLGLWQNDRIVYTFYSREGSHETGVVYLNTDPYKITSEGPIESCILYY